MANTCCAIFILIKSEIGARNASCGCVSWLGGVGVPVWRPSGQIFEMKKHCPMKKVKYENMYHKIMFPSTVNPCNLCPHNLRCSTLLYTIRSHLLHTITLAICGFRNLRISQSALQFCSVPKSADCGVLLYNNKKSPLKMAAVARS